jgi:hypothetical protein
MISFYSSPMMSEDVVLSKYIRLMNSVDALIDVKRVWSYSDRSLLVNAVIALKLTGTVAKTGS